MGNDGRFNRASQGELTLYKRNNIPVLKGSKLASNLYRSNLQPNAKSTNSFSSTPPNQSWETWHRRYGHVNYDDLKKLYKNNLVDGFNVNTKTSTPDCPACVKGKQSVSESFPSQVRQRAEK